MGEDKGKRCSQNALRDLCSSSHQPLVIPVFSPSPSTGFLCGVRVTDKHKATSPIVTMLVRFGMSRVTCGIASNDGNRNIIIIKKTHTKRNKKIQIKTQKCWWYERCTLTVQSAIRVLKNPVAHCSYNKQENSDNIEKEKKERFF